MVIVASCAAAQLATVYVPALHGPFGTEALTAVQLAVVLALSSIVFVTVELRKAVARRSASDRR